MRRGVPRWAALLPCGELVEGAAGSMPTRVLRENRGAVLAFRFGPFYVVCAPAPGSRVDWLTTVDAAVGGGDARRLVGPGIEGGLTRAWLDPRGVIYITDGPLEVAELARERLLGAIQRRSRGHGD